MPRQVKYLDSTRPDRFIVQSRFADENRFAMYCLAFVPYKNGRLQYLQIKLFFCHTLNLAARSAQKMPDKKLEGIQANPTQLP